MCRRAFEPLFHTSWDSAADPSDNEQAVTPLKTSNAHKIIFGRVTKQIFPRNTLAKKYKKLKNPFADMNWIKKDGEDRSEEEDSNTLDIDYGHQKKAVKMEQNEIIP